MSAVNRRRLLAGTALVAVAAAVPRTASADVAPTNIADGFAGVNAPGRNGTAPPAARAARRSP